MILYKYYSPESFDFLFDEEGISLRFSQPELLNDPFESNLGIGLNNNQSIKKVISEMQTIKDSELNKYRLDETITDVEREYILSELNLFFIEKIKELHDENSKERKELQNLLEYKNLGILSLSKNENSREMWAHYSKNHTGFMIEIDIRNLRTYKYSEHLEKEKIVKDLKGFVTYSNKRPTLKDFKNCKKDRLKNLAFVKDEVWKYENEFRIISFLDMIPSKKIDNNGLGIHCETLKSKDIKRIILGVRSSKILEKKILTWVSNYASNVEVKKAVPCTDTFEFFYDDL